MNPDSGINFTDFKDAWLQEVRELRSNAEKGRRFGIKIASEFLGVDPDDLILNDGSGDGGIDVAYFVDGTATRDRSSEGDDAPNTWHIFQCKYGASSTGARGVLAEGKKFLSTVSRESSSIPAEREVIEKLRNFCNPTQGEQHERERNYRLVYVFATVDPPNRSAAEQLGEIRKLGNAQMSASGGPVFEVNAISLRTLFEQADARFAPFELTGRFHRAKDDQANGMWIGTVTIFDLYRFMKSYESATQELNQIYEKNIRMYLGMKSPTGVNRGLLKTLREYPDKLGLFNNGVTIVASDIQGDPQLTSDSLRLDMPYIVNGCQTTRTIFDYVDRKLDAGLSIDHPDVIATTASMKAGVLVVKAISSESDIEIGDITRYSNTQNAIYERDFVAIHDKFQYWKKQLATEHGRFLDIQKGSWASQRALESRRPNARPRFTDEPNAEPIQANEMIKIFGAGWLGYAGSASRHAVLFRAPLGRIFKEIEGLSEIGEFGPDSFLAAFRLQQCAKELGFGPRKEWPRNLTKNHLYYLVVELLRSIIADREGSTTNSQVTDAILKLGQGTGENLMPLAEAAADILDEYFGASSEGDREPPFREDEGILASPSERDFIQGPLLDGKDGNLKKYGHNLWLALDSAKRGLRQRFGVQPSIRDQYRAALGLELDSRNH